MLDLNEDGVADILSRHLDDIMGSDWQRGDRFMFDGFEYRIGHSYGEYTSIIPTEY